MVRKCNDEEEDMNITKERQKLGIIYCILYSVCGLFLLFKYDYKVGILYFTTMPITFVIFYVSYKRLHNFSLAVYLFLLFLAQGVNPFLFYIYKDSYMTYGYASVGSFDFSLLAFYKVFLQVILISLVIVGVSEVNHLFLGRVAINIKKRHSDLIIRLPNERIRKITSFLCIVFCVVGCAISIFMFNRQIGVLGFISIKMPFRLVGIMYYTRLLIINGCVLVLYVLSQNKYLLIPICIYSYIITLSANSKLCGLCVLVFIIIFEVLNRKKIRAALLMMYTFMVYDVLSYTRYFIYESDGNNVNSITGRTDLICHTFSEVFMKSLFYIRDFILNIDEKILETLHNITSRLFGTQMLVIGSQYKDCVFEDFIYYLQTGSIYKVKPDILEELLKIQVETMGFGFGHIGDLIILGSGRIFQLCLIAVVIGILLNAFEDIICVLSTYTKSAEWDMMWRCLSLVLVSSLWLQIIITIESFFKIVIGGIGVIFVLRVYNKFAKRKE